MTQAQTTVVGIDPRFIREDGKEIFSGPELLIKGALETQGGVQLLTGCSRPPTADFFETLRSIRPLLHEKGIIDKLTHDEALSIAMVSGAQIAGCRAMAVFPSVGLPSASGALAQGMEAGTVGDGGGLIVCGDDPWTDSNHTWADPRSLAEHLRLPIIEPSTAQEVKDWVNLGFQLSRAGQIYIGYLMRVFTMHGGGSVECYPNHNPLSTAIESKQFSFDRDSQLDLDRRAQRPNGAGWHERTLDKRFDAVKILARQLGINRIWQAPQKGEVVPLGFIAPGAAYASLAQALFEMGLYGKLPILKLGMPYPVDEQIVADFASRCRWIIVVEDGRGLVERQVAEISRSQRPTDPPHAQVFGKRFPHGLPGIPTARNLHPSRIIERLVPLIRKHARLPIELTNGRLSDELQRIHQTSQGDLGLPDRTPTFCPGCPQRDASGVLLDLRRDLLDPSYMLSKHKRKPIDLLVHGDTGCATLLAFEPFKPLIASGASTGWASGTGLEMNHKQVAFMGDESFFHGGQATIGHSIRGGQDITYVIVDNKTTALAAHRHGADGNDALTDPPTRGPAQDIHKIVKAMTPKASTKEVRILRVNPAQRDRYRAALEQAILADGVKVVITDKECGLTRDGRVRAAQRQQRHEHGFMRRQTYMNVATEVCEMCLECTRHTACPGLTTVETDDGPKIQTDLSWCVDDGACQRVNACPAFEQVTVIRKQPPRRGDNQFDGHDLPDPPRPIHADQPSWRCHVAGVGGTGVDLCTAILTAAGHQMGYHVQFLDLKGLAVRNGGIFSQVLFTRTTPRTPGNAAAQGPVHDLDRSGSVSATPTNGSNGHVAASPVTPMIPYGKADLILGTDLLEAARGIDPKHPQRVASRDRTAAVINTTRTPTTATMMGQEAVSTRALEAALQHYLHPQRYLGFNVGDLCDHMLDSKLEAPIVMLGIAFQKGFLPLSAGAITSAIQEVVGDQIDQPLKAFNAGREIVIDPDPSWTEAQHDRETARQAVRRKTQAIRARYGSGKRTDRLIGQFRALLQQTLRATRGQRIDDPLRRDVVLRVYGCFTWGGVDYARAYCRRVESVFKKDRSAYGWAATRAVVVNLAKVMLIKDEVYVAALLTDPEKAQRDRRRFNADPDNDDRILYRHYTRPEFEILGKKIRFDWVSRDWQLRLLSRMRFLRRLMPKWHLPEKRFCQWYETLVDTFTYTTPRDYQRWLAILRVPETVNGYRGVRYPKMDAARRRAEEFLKTDPQLFEPDGVLLTQHHAQHGPVVHLPVVSGM